MRTMLTVFGVVIGTASIIVMVSLGIGVNVSFEEQMKNWGDLTMITVYNWSGYQGYDKSAPILDDAVIQTLNDMPHVVAASPVMEGYYKFVSGRYAAQIPVRGINPEAVEAFGYKLGAGEFFSDAGDMQILFSDDAKYQFLSAKERNAGNVIRSVSSISSEFSVMTVGVGGQSSAQDERKSNVNPLTDRFQMSYDYNFGEKTTETTGKKADTYKIKIMGVLQKDDDWERSYYSIMPIAQVQKIANDQQKWYKANGARGNTQETQGYERALIKVDNIDSAEKIVEALKEMNFQDVYSPTSYIQNMKEMSGQLQMLLAAIGAVSLFVAAIGIANTMIMSIYERTKEIGVMKVIGARLKDIGRLFLLEASMIGFFGGIFGLGLSFAISYILNNVTGLNVFQQMFSGSGGSSMSVIPAWLALAGLVFSTAIGLISGFLPARRAMKISAISAIRTE
jgi:ABC-type antimicrobial peptide transport system permease subunit